MRYSSMVEEGYLPRVDSSSDQAILMQNQEIAIIDNGIYNTKVVLIGGAELDPNPTRTSVLSHYFPSSQDVPLIAPGDAIIRFRNFAKATSNLDLEDTFLVIIRRASNSLEIYTNPDVSVASLLADPNNIDVLTKIKQQFGDYNIIAPEEVKTTIQNIQLQAGGVAGPGSSAQTSVQPTTSSLLGLGWVGLRNSETGSFQFPIRSSNPAPIKPGEVFDSRVEIQKILGEKGKPLDQQKADLALFKAKLSYQKLGGTMLQGEILYAFKRDPQVSIESLQKIIDKNSSKYGFANWQKDKLVQLMDVIQVRRNRMNELMSQYPDPADFVKAMYGFTPTGRVKMEQGPLSINLEMTNESDFVHILKGASPSPNEIANNHAGAFVDVGHGLLPDSAYLVTVKRPETDSSLLDEILGASLYRKSIHEEEHIINATLKQVGLFSIDARKVDADFAEELLTKIGNQEALSPEEQISLLQELSKTVQNKMDADYSDEMLAYLREGTPDVEIAFLLLAPKSMGNVATYDFRTHYNEMTVMALGMTNIDVDLILTHYMSSPTFTGLTHRVGDGLESFNKLMSKGYSRSQAVALLEKATLSEWPKIAERATPQSSVRRIFNQTLEAFLTPANISRVVRKISFRNIGVSIAESGLGVFIRNIIDPPLGIVDPAFRNFTDIEWVGVRNPETGTFQFPFGKPSEAPIIKPGEIFDAKMEMSLILGTESQHLSTAQKRANLASFKAKSGYQEQGITQTETHILDALTKNPDTSKSELLEIVNQYGYKYGFSVQQKSKFADALDIFEQRRTRIKTIMEQYPTGELLYEAMFGRKPLGKVEASQGAMTIHFKIYEGYDYNYVRHANFQNPDIVFDIDYTNRNAGFALSQNTLLPNTRNLVVVENHTIPAGDVSGSTVFIHEDLHQLNSLLRQIGVFPFGRAYLDDSIITALVRSNSPEQIKKAYYDLLRNSRNDADASNMNEMLAYLKEGKYPNKRIEYYLTTPIEDGGIYDFYSDGFDGVSTIKSQLKQLGVNYDLDKLAPDALNLELGPEAQKTTIKNGLDAFNKLISKGYTRDEVIATLQRSPLSSWPKVAERLPNSATQLEKVNFEVSMDLGGGSKAYLLPGYVDQDFRFIVEGETGITLIGQPIDVIKRAALVIDGQPATKPTMYYVGSGTEFEVDGVKYRLSVSNDNELAVYRIIETPRLSLEKPSVLETVGEWFSENIIRPRLGIVDPAFRNFTDIEWRGFRNPETGKLQFPIGKPITPPPYIETVLPIDMQLRHVFDSEVEATNSQRISQIDSDIELNPNPYLPLRSNPIDPILARKWIDKQPTPETRKAAEALVANIQHITIDEFKRALTVSINDFNRIMGEEKYVTIAPKAKSNKWVFELSLPILNKLPEHVVGGSTINYVNDNTGDYLSAYLKSHPDIKNVVIFDDAIYSGQQVSTLIGVLRDDGIDISKLHFIITVPYSTNYGLQKVLKDFPNSRITFTEHNTIQSVGELIPDPSLQQDILDIREIRFIKDEGPEEAGDLTNRTLTYFDHKVPDKVSTLNFPELPFIPKTPTPYGNGFLDSYYGWLEDVGKVSVMDIHGLSGISIDDVTINFKIYEIDGKFVLTDKGLGIKVYVTRGSNQIPITSTTYVDLQKGDIIYQPEHENFESPNSPLVQLEFDGTKVLPVNGPKEIVLSTDKNGLIGSGPAQLFERLAQTTIYKWLPGSAERGTLPVLIDMLSSSWRGFRSSEGRLQWPFGKTSSLRPPTVAVTEGTVLAKALPENTGVGSAIAITNTIDANVDTFSALYRWRIAQKYGLDIKNDFEKIEQMSHDPEIINPIKADIMRDSIGTYTVTQELSSPKSDVQEPNFDYPKDFFEKYDYLPGGGIFVVPASEFKGVDKLYIGGGTDTPAYNNMGKNGIYGDLKLNPTYFSTDYEVAMSHMNDSTEDRNPVLIVVSSARLLELRKVLIDPESFNVKAEQGKTFITFHGIPVSAIERILVFH